jgi:hexokinase
VDILLKCTCISHIHPLSIAISGDVYKDYPSFHPRVCEAIKDLIPEEVASKLSVGIVQHSRIVGAAIVAMMAEKMDTEMTTD